MSIIQFPKLLTISLLLTLTAIACRPTPDTSASTSNTPSPSPAVVSQASSEKSPIVKSPIVDSTSSPTATATTASGSTARENQKPTEPSSTSSPEPQKSPEAADTTTTTEYLKPIDNATNGAAFIKFIYAHDKQSVMLNSELATAVTTGEDWMVVFSDCENLPQGQQPSIQMCAQGINFKLEPIAGQSVLETVGGKRVLKGIWRVETIPGMNQGFLSVKLTRLK
jgi:hypothetical protein